MQRARFAALFLCVATLVLTVAVAYGQEIENAGDEANETCKDWTPEKPQLKCITTVEGVKNPVEGLCAMKENKPSCKAISFFDVDGKKYFFNSSDGKSVAQDIPTPTRTSDIVQLEPHKLTDPYTPSVLPAQTEPDTKLPETQPSTLPPSAQNVAEQIEQAGKKEGTFSSVTTKVKEWVGDSALGQWLNPKLGGEQAELSGGLLGENDTAFLNDSSAAQNPTPQTSFSGSTFAGETATLATESSVCGTLCTARGYLSSAWDTAVTGASELFGVSSAVAKPSMEPQASKPDIIGQERFDITGYLPCTSGSCSMQGGLESARKGPDGLALVRTLDDWRLGKSDYVTAASDPSRYGETYVAREFTYRSPLDGKTYTLNNVPIVVHDTGSAFQGRPDKLDIAIGFSNSDRDAMRLASNQPFLAERYQTYQQIANGAVYPYIPEAAPLPQPRPESAPPADIVQSAFPLTPIPVSSEPLASYRPWDDTLPRPSALTPHPVAKVETGLPLAEPIEPYPAQLVERGGDLAEPRPVVAVLRGDDLSEPRPILPVERGTDLLPPHPAGSVERGPDLFQPQPITAVVRGLDIEQPNPVGQVFAGSDLAEPRPVTAVEQGPDLAQPYPAGGVERGTDLAEPRPTVPVERGPDLEAPPEKGWFESTRDTITRGAENLSERFTGLFGGTDSATKALTEPTQDIPESAIPQRQEYSAAALELQEKVLGEQLQTQTTALTETSGTLSDDAIARGMAACESAPAGRTCSAYRTYAVAVQTEQTKYDEVVRNYEAFNAYKNQSGELTDSLKRSLTEIEKGQGATSAALEQYAKEYKDAAKSWFSPIAEGYREGDWTSVAKESWRAVPAAGNAIWGGLTDEAKVAAERFAPESLDFRPAPEQAARCGAVGQSLCDAEGTVSAANVVGSAWIAKEVAQIGPRLFSSSAKAADDIVPTLSAVDDVVRAPPPSLIDDAIRAPTRVADDVPVAPSTQPQIGVTRVADDVAKIDAPTIPASEADDLARVKAIAADIRRPVTEVTNAPPERTTVVSDVRGLAEAERKLDDAVAEIRRIDAGLSPEAANVAREAAMDKVLTVADDLKAIATRNPSVDDLARRVDDIAADLRAQNLTRELRPATEKSLDDFSSSLRSIDKSMRSEASLTERIQIAYYDAKQGVSNWWQGRSSESMVDIAPPSPIDSRVVRLADEPLIDDATYARTSVETPPPPAAERGIVRLADEPQIDDATVARTAAADTQPKTAQIIPFPSAGTYAVDALRVAGGTARFVCTGGSIRLGVCGTAGFGTYISYQYGSPDSNIVAMAPDSREASAGVQPTPTFYGGIEYQTNDQLRADVAAPNAPVFGALEYQTNDVLRPDVRAGAETTPNVPAYNGAIEYQTNDTLRPDVAAQAEKQPNEPVYGALEYQTN